MKHDVLLTTTSQLQGWEIDDYLGPVSAQFVIGTGLFTDYLASWTDLFGAHSRSYQQKLERIHTEALELISEKAHRLRANLVLGLRVDHDEISGSGKSMLMVTASGTAARGRRMVRAGQAASHRDDASLSAAAYREMRARAEILEQARNGTLDWFANDTWRNVLDCQVPEVSDHLMQFLDGRIRNSRPEEEETLTLRMDDYFGSLPYDDAVGLLYRSLAYAPPIARRAIFLLRAMDGFDPELIQNILLTDDNARRRSRSLSAVQADLPWYCASDRARLASLRDAIPTAFPPAAVHEEKGIIHKRRAWTCVNDHAVSARDDCCPVCTADRRGFEHGFLLPEDAVEELNRKLAVLESHYAPG